MIVQSRQAAHIERRANESRVYEERSAYKRERRKVDARSEEGTHGTTHCIDAQRGSARCCVPCVHTVGSVVCVR